MRGFGPGPEKPGAPKPTGGSFLEWRNVQLIPTTPKLVLPEGERVPALWRVKGGDPWQFARETDSALVQVLARETGNRSASDYEKFLFYRGLGTFEMPLEVRSDGVARDVRLTLTNRGPQPIRSVFAVKVA